MWSTAGVVTRHLEHARSFEVTFWRSLFNALVLLVLLPISQGREVFADMRRGGSALWISGLCWSVMFTAFMVAIMLTTVANVLVTMSLAPLFTALLSRAFLGQRIAARTWLAIFMAGIGIVWMYASQLGASSWSGTLIALGVPMAASTNWTVVQRSQASGQKVDLAPAVLVGALISVVVMLPLSLPFEASGFDLGLLAFLGGFQLAVPCLMAVACAGVLKAPEVALLALLEVIFGILLAWAGAGERPSPQVLAGGSLVIAALVLNELIGLKEISP
jgi:drug/metabolite transporter (DMT)-like permease